MSIADYLFPYKPEEMNTQTIINIVQTLTNLYTLLYCRVVGEIGVHPLKLGG